MGQQEVLNVLKKEKLMTAREIAEILQIARGAVLNALNRMLDFDVEKIYIHLKRTRDSKAFAWKIIGTEIPQELLKKYEQR